MAIKSKKTYKPTKISRKYDIKYLGFEPEVEEWADADHLYIYNWYNYFHKTDEMWAWVSKWLEDNAPKSKFKLHQLIPSRKIAVMCRLSSTGMSLSKEEREEIYHYLKHGPKVKQSVEKIEIKKSPVDYTKRKLRDHISFIEEVLDSLDVKFSFEDYFIKQQIKPALKKGIWNYYLPIYKELLTINDDDELKEAYSSWKKTDINKLKKIYKALESCCEIKKVVTKRIKKAIPIDKQVEKMKYQKESAEYNIKSVKKVSSIIGAKVVWLFNTKSRGLTLLKSNDGLKVSGTTIKEYNEDTSFGLKLRKPADVLPLINKISRAASMVPTPKALTSVTTKKYSANGRCNNDTIILRVIK